MTAYYRYSRQRAPNPADSSPEPCALLRGQVAAEQAVEGGVQVGVGGTEDVGGGRQRALARLPPAVELLDGLQEGGEVLVAEPRARPAPPRGQG